jgi:hypothetical protein
MTVRYSFQSSDLRGRKIAEDEDDEEAEKLDDEAMEPSIINESPELLW